MRPDASTIVPEPMRSVPRMRAEGCDSGMRAWRWTVEGSTRSMRPTAAFTRPTLDARPARRKRGRETSTTRARAVDAPATHPYDPPMRVVPLALRRDPREGLASLADEPGAFLLEEPDPAQPGTLLGCAPPTQLP